MVGNYVTDDSGYRDRYVAFLDILGFAQLTEKADQHPNWRAWLRDCINSLHQTLPPKDETRGFRFVQFSDSVVISVDRTPDGLSTMFYSVQMLYRNMLQRGMLMRGGIAAGNFHHDDHLMFGPALVRAYAFEENGAPPHVGLHEAVLEDMRPSLISSVGHGYWLTYDPWDTTPMLNVLAEFANYDAVPRAGVEPLDQPAFYLAKTIEENASSQSLPPSARAKWRWLQHYWNQTVAPKGILQQSGPYVDWGAAFHSLQHRLANTQSNSLAGMDTNANE